MHHVEVKQLFDCILNILNTGVTKLHNLIAICTNKMIVLLIPVRFFVLRKVFAKLVLADQVAFYQKIERIINGGTAYPVVLVLHVDVQRLNIEVAVE
jgi:hypothetical protein